MRYCFLIALAFFFFSCSGDSGGGVQVSVDPTGKLVQMGGMSQFSVSEVSAIAEEALNSLGISDPHGTIITPFELKYPIQVAKVIYSTFNKEGDVVYASGVIAAPVSSGSFPVLSIQHSMVTHRSNVASSYVYTLGTSSGITPELLSGILTASRGFITLLPDYLGFGVSHENHPFCNRELTASAVVNMMRAVEPEFEEINITANGKFFLFGHSQGGYSTIAALDLLEQKFGTTFPVTACAASAGPYALSNMVPEVFSQVPLVDNLYAPYLLYSIINSSGVGSVDEVYHGLWVDKIPSYFDGSKSTFELRAVLPFEKEKIFSAEFISAAKEDTGIGSKYIDAIAENDLIDIAPSTDIRLYYGDLDVHIPGAINAQKADSAWSINGSGDISVIELVGTDHFSSYVPAFMDAVIWFSSM